jgi:formiminotetrahydrofolate cyclodeaminase
MYLSNSIEKYIDDLSAKLPAPGGGSAAALTGAMGVSLIIMVLSYTIGKEKYKEFEEELIKAQDEAKELKQKLSNLIDKDVEAYKKVALSFSSQDGTIKEKTLKDASIVPIEICNCCYESMRICRKIIDKSNKNLISDIAVAVEFLQAAYNSALFNIRTNLKDIKDKEFGINIAKAIEPQREEMEKLKDTVIKFIDKEL